MMRTLLTLVALCSQALSLVGPGVVVCRDRQGRVCLEFAGQPCTCCLPPAPQASPPPAAACGCCRYRPEPADAPQPAARDAAPPCDCEHTPLADGADRPCLLPAPVAVDPPAADAPPWAAVALTLSVDADRRGGHHDPPGSGPSRPAHLPLLSGVVLRC